jgi:Protein tyrosine and serine/threonine kinase
LIATLDANAPVVAKISDFGLSKAGVGAVCGVREVLNPAWLAPEAMPIRGAKYTCESDVYSYAIILWELCTRQHPFAEFEFRFESSLEDAIVRDGIRPTVPDEVRAERPQLAKLIARCWHNDPQRRPTFSKIVQQLDAASAAPLRVHSSSSSSSLPSSAAPAKAQQQRGGSRRHRSHRRRHRHGNRLASGGGVADEDDERAASAVGDDDDDDDDDDEHGGDERQAGAADDNDGDESHSSSTSSSATSSSSLSMSTMADALRDGGAGDDAVTAAAASAAAKEWTTRTLNVVPSASSIEVMVHVGSNEVWIGCGDGRIEQWSAGDRELLGELPRVHQRSVSSLVFDAPTSTVWSGALDERCALVMWNRSAGRVRKQLKRCGRVCAVACDGRSAMWCSVVSAYQNAIELRSRRSGRVKKVIVVEQEYGPATCLALVGTDSMWGGHFKVLRHYSVAERACMRTVRAHNDAIHDIVYDRVRRRVWTASNDKRVNVWNEVDGSYAAALDGHTSRVFALAQVGNHIWSASWDKSIIMWDAASLRFVTSIADVQSDDGICSLLAMVHGIVWAGSLNGHVALLAPKSVKETQLVGWLDALQQSPVARRRQCPEISPSLELCIDRTHSHVPTSSSGSSVSVNEEEDEEGDDADGGDVVNWFDFMRSASSSALAVAPVVDAELFSPLVDNAQRSSGDGDADIGTSSSGSAVRWSEEIEKADEQDDDQLVDWMTALSSAASSRALPSSPVAPSRRSDTIVHPRRRSSGAIVQQRSKDAVAHPSRNGNIIRQSSSSDRIDNSSDNDVVDWLSVLRADCDTIKHEQQPEPEDRQKSKDIDWLSFLKGE